MPLFLFLFLFRVNSCDRQTVFLNATKAIYGLKLELVGHAVADHAEYALILALIPHMRLYFPTPHKPHVEYALMFSKSEHHIRIILRFE